MKREYSDSDRAYAIQVLANTQGNLSETARLTGIPRKTVAYWAAQTGVRGVILSSNSQGAQETDLGGASGEQNSPVRRMGTELDRQEAIAGWATARNLNLSAMSDPEKIKKASLKDNTIAAGTAQDKFNILTGGATQRVEHLQVSLVAGGSLRELAAAVLGGRVEPTRPIVETNGHALPERTADSSR